MPASTPSTSRSNTSSSTLSLTGDTVHDAVGHTYTFDTFHLSAGKTVYLHIGTGTWQHRYWGQDWYVWNNNGDTAHLHNALGTLRDACTVSGSAPRLHQLLTVLDPPIGNLNRPT